MRDAPSVRECLYLFVYRFAFCTIACARSRVQSSDYVAQAE